MKQLQRVLWVFHLKGKKEVVGFKVKKKGVFWSRVGDEGTLQSGDMGAQLSSHHCLSSSLSFLFLAYIMAALSRCASGRDGRALRSDGGH